MRSDDGVAWRAADQLEEKFRAGEDGVEIVRCHQLAPELAEAVSHSEAAIFLDAAPSGAGAEPGELGCEEILPSVGETSFSHQLSPSAVLTLSRQLFGASPRAYVLTLAGECFDHGEWLSPGVEAAIPELVARTEALVEQLLCEAFPTNFRKP